MNRDTIVHKNITVGDTPLVGSMVLAMVSMLWFFGDLIYRGLSPDAQGFPLLAFGLMLLAYVLMGALLWNKREKVSMTKNQLSQSGVEGGTRCRQRN